MYCKECAKTRKQTCDRESWRRRWQKSRKDTNSRRTIIEARLLSQHASELGISLVYYNLWKEQNPKSYRKWMDEHIDKKQEENNYVG